LKMHAQYARTYKYGRILFRTTITVVIATWIRIGGICKEQMVRGTLEGHLRDGASEHINKLASLVDGLVKENEMMKKVITRHHNILNTGMCMYVGVCVYALVRDVENLVCMYVCVWYTIGYLSLNFEAKDAAIQDSPMIEWFGFTWKLVIIAPASILTT
jgi:hypothetical protein